MLVPSPLLVLRAPDSVVMHSEAWVSGDPAALGRLVPAVAADLRRVAARCLRRERPDHTLQPTALVNEFYLRLAGRAPMRWSSRQQFLGLAGAEMRRILVDHARTRLAAKRGARRVRVVLEDVGSEADERMEALDLALARLARLSPRQARVVELRFFAGFTAEEIGRALGLSLRTIEREVASAKAWLSRELGSRE